MHFLITFSTCSLSNHHNSMRKYYGFGNIQLLRKSVRLSGYYNFSDCCKALRLLLLTELSFTTDSNTDTGNIWSRVKHMPLFISAQRGFRANYKVLRILIKFDKSSTFINTNHKMFQEFRNLSGIMQKFE